MYRIISIISVFLCTAITSWTQIDNTAITVRNNPTIQDIDYVCNSGNVSVMINSDDTTNAVYSVTSVAPTTVVIPPDNNTGTFDLTGSTAATFSIMNQYGCTIDTLIIFNCNQPLPIELVSFNAALYDKNKGLLTWNIIDDKSVNNYELFESKNASDYELLTTTTSARTEGEYSYQFIDQALNKGNNYYQLKINKDDGTPIMSPVRVIYYDENDDIEFLLFPNPTNGIVYATLESQIEDELTVNIIDNLGRIVIPKENYTIVKGNNKIQFDLTRLAADTYIFQYALSKNKMSGSIKLVKKQ